MSKTESSAIEAAVLRANANFYRAFTNGDFAAMSLLWAERAPVSCLHPGSSALIGREAVLESWRTILREPPRFEMRADYARAQMLGSLALVICYEGNAERPAHLAATNVFVLEDEQWRIVHHQAGPLAHPIEPPVPQALTN